MMRTLLASVIVLGALAGCGSATAEKDTAAPAATPEVTAEADAPAATGMPETCTGGPGCCGGGGACSQTGPGPDGEGGCPCQRRQRLIEKARRQAAERAGEE